MNVGTARQSRRHSAYALLKHIPSCLVAGRILLGPTLFLMATRGIAGRWLILGLTAAFLSDVFDGVLARRIGVATERLRVADSRADCWFYVWMAAAVWQTAPEIIRAFHLPLLLVISLQLFSYACDLVKYRRIASFHAYTAKVWGLTLFMATVALLGLHTGGSFLWLAILLGIISNIEGFAIKTVLPEWQHDVPSVFHALRSRREKHLAGR
jgi:CDP-diacylglycerol--glycerol-3-phosphate 3-phosphatidyltransferase